MQSAIIPDLYLAKYLAINILLIFLLTANNLTRFLMTTYLIIALMLTASTVYGLSEDKKR